MYKSKILNKLLRVFFLLKTGKTTKLDHNQPIIKFDSLVC